MDSNLIGTVLQWLLGLLAMALLALLARGGLWMAAKAKESKLWALVAQVYELASSVVAHVDAEMRPKVAKALADGRVTAEEGAELKAEALRLLKEQLGAQGLARLEKLKGLTGTALDTYLSGVLEKALKALRGASGSMGGPELRARP